MSEKLTKCGCGSEAYAHMIGYNETKGYYISCDLCGTKTMIFETLEEAVKTWNTAMGKRSGEVTVEPERKKGKWISHFDDLFPEESTQECSVCHEEESLRINNDNFCPNCGADMTPDEVIKAAEPVNSVNHPTHYKGDKFECIDVMEDVYGKEAVKHFCMLNAFKYIYRQNKKNGIEDVKKAIWYLNKYLEIEEKDN